MANSTFGKQLCYLYLNGDPDKRNVNVNKNSPDNYWNNDVEFLVVPASFFCKTPQALMALGSLCCPRLFLPAPQHFADFYQRLRQFSKSFVI